jgi:hypothetical protein
MATAVSDHLQVVNNRVARVTLRIMPLAMLAAVGFIFVKFEEKPDVVMFNTGLIAAALALILFQVLVHRVPQTFRTLWDQDVIGPACASAPGRAEPAGERPQARADSASSDEFSGHHASTRLTEERRLR